jgi:hypothetical protein
MCQLVDHAWVKYGMLVEMSGKIELELGESKSNASRKVQSTRKLEERKKKKKIVAWRSLREYMKEEYKNQSQNRGERTKER